MQSLSILVVHPELPMPDRHSGSLRLWRLVEALVEHGHSVTFVARAGHGQEAYVAELAELGVEVYQLDPRRFLGRDAEPPGALDLAALIRRRRFDVAWLSFYHVAEQYLPEIRAYSPATRIIIDTVDIHWVREHRGAELSGDAAQLAAAERTRAREQHIYSQADALVAVTEDDARALADLAPGVHTAVIGNIHVEDSAGPGFDERSGLVFVGNFEHVPNVDAMVHFCTTVLPSVQERLPGINLSIVGQAPPPAVSALASPSVNVTGWVAEVIPYLDSARVSIAPLRYGAGVKGKIGEALSHGLPVVTTTIGAEGMDLVDGEHALIADDSTFAERICRLHEDRALWERLAAGGRAHLTRQLSADAAVQRLRELLEVAVPRCFVACEPWSDPQRLRDTLSHFVAEFEPGAAATLVLPAPVDELSLEEAGARTEAALREIGADPEQIPDIHVASVVGTALVPRNAVAVGRPSEEPEPARRSLEATSQPADSEPAQKRAEDRSVEVSIIICAYGKREYSERCLASLEQALGDRLGRSWELVLVNNASPDSTAELFSQWSSRAKVLNLRRNRNFAGGNNAGAEVATGEVLIFLNNDTEVPLGALEALAEEARQPGIGIVGTRLLYPDGRIQHGGFAWRWNGQTLQPFHLFHFENGSVAAAQSNYDIGFVTGACMAMPAEVFRAVGGFDEGYVNGWEDVDLCLKVRSAGERVRYRGDVHLVHHEGVTGGGSYNDSGNVRRFAVRWSRLLIDDRHLVQRTLGAEFSPLADIGEGPLAPDGAGVILRGPIHSLGSAGAETRGLLGSLVAAGVDVAARRDAPTWVGPALGETQWRQLLDAHARAVRPDALSIRVGPGDGSPGGGPTILRLAQPCRRRPDNALAWVASPAVMDELLAGGWPADAVALVPPAGIEPAPGNGGGGALVILPGNLQLACVALDALDGLSVDAIRVLPTVRSSELRRLVADRIPGAELLPPATDELHLQRLAASSDVVLALNPDDGFDRQALLVASTGAAVVVRPGGPAHAVLGSLAQSADVADEQAIARAAGCALERVEQRQERVEAVAAACAPDAVLAALELNHAAVR